MWSKIKTFIQEVVVPVGCLIVCILLYVSQCSKSGGYSEQLVSLTATLDDLESTINDLGDGLGQQELLLGELTDGQSRIESTIRDITGTVDSTNEYLEQLIQYESDVDGAVGAVRATTKRLSDTINTTVLGLEQSEEL